MKAIAYTVAGVAAGSMLAWASLMAWAALTLDPRDSLFDRSPEAMRMFLIAWLLIAVIGALTGLLLSKRKKTS